MNELGGAPEDDEPGFEDAVGTDKLLIVKRDLAFEKAMAQQVLPTLSEQQRKSLEYVSFFLFYNHILHVILSPHN